jgi:hypothetical protein
MLTPSVKKLIARQRHDSNRKFDIYDRRRHRIIWVLHHVTGLVDDRGDELTGRRFDSLSRLFQKIIHKHQ